MPEVNCLSILKMNVHIDWLRADENLFYPGNNGIKIIRIQVFF